MQGIHKCLWNRSINNERGFVPWQA